MKIDRQAKILRAGGEIRQETRRFDDKTGETILMRVKEGASDYRYFPEPDLPRIEISEAWINEVRASIPEMPSKRRERYVSEFGLPEYDARQLTSSKDVSDFFEAAVKSGGDAKLVSNWLQREVAQYLNTAHLELKDIHLTPENLQMLRLIADGTISSKIAKKVFLELAKNGGSAEAFVKKAGLVQISDPAVLLPIIHEVFAKNEQSVADYRGGKENAAKALVGQLMKATTDKPIQQ